jgi:hypothetical protein
MQFEIMRPSLVVPDPWDSVSRFFTKDISNRYDEYILSAASPHDAITREDISAINSWMGARSPHKDWDDLIGAGRIDELIAISPDWDLFLMSDEEWTQRAIPDMLMSLFIRVTGPGIAIARATKLLHIKRPRLVPVSDSFVLRQLAIPGEGPAAGVSEAVQLREQRHSLLPRLQELQERLDLELGVQRTLVRIADVLIWGSHPDTWMARREATA